MSIRSSSATAGRPDWLGLRWSAWMPLMAAHPLALAQLPSAPGVYRVRRAGESHEPLWIGWAAGGIREAVERLSRQVHLPVQPYDDPTAPARILWKERVQHGASFEVSGAPVDRDSAEAEGVVREITKYLSSEPQPPYGE